MRKFELLQPSVLRFGLLVDGNVGISMFPEGKESLIRLPRGCLVAHYRLRTTELQMGQRTYYENIDYAGMVDYLLELRDR